MRRGTDIQRIAERGSAWGGGVDHAPWTARRADPTVPYRRSRRNRLERDRRFEGNGRGRFLDNIFIERLWRSLKYEAVYLHELCDGMDAERIIATWVDFYNEVRPHLWLGGRTPGEAYRDGAALS